MKRILFLFPCAILLQSCSSGPTKDPTYISPIHYQSYDCKQISMEMDRVSKKIDVKTQTEAAPQVLNTALAAFAISQGYGVYGEEENVELRRLKNQYDVLDETAIRKKCHIS